MILKTTLNGNSYAFKDVKDVLAKANEPKSADRLQAIAAENETERVAAKIVLADLTVKDLVENPTVPYEKDEVTRVNLDGMNKRNYEFYKNMTIGDLREYILSHKTTEEDLKRLSTGITGEVAAGVAKLCGLSFGSGDACIGINPVEDNIESTKRIADKLFEFLDKEQVPTQLTVLSHVTTQMEALRKGVPLSMCFQSIAGTQKTNEDFGVSKDLLLEAYHVASQYGFNKGPNLLYFETGQGSEVTVNGDEGVDEMTLEGRKYGFARFFKPFMVNNVSGFIGPETIYDGKEMLRANLEDLFMGKIMGLPMGMAPCFTNHTPINIDDQQIGTMLLTMAGSNYFMGVPGGDDVMLAYMDTSYHDDVALRELMNKKPAPEFHKWCVKKGIMDEEGRLTEIAGDGSIFLK